MLWALSKPLSKQTSQLSLSQITFYFQFYQHKKPPTEMIINFELRIDYYWPKKRKAKFYLQYQKLSRKKKYFSKTRRHLSCFWSYCHRLMNNDSLKSKIGNFRKKNHFIPWTFFHAQLLMDIVGVEGH